MLPAGGGSRELVGKADETHGSPTRRLSVQGPEDVRTAERGAGDGDQAEGARARGFKATSRRPRVLKYSRSEHCALDPETSGDLATAIVPAGRG